MQRLSLNLWNLNIFYFVQKYFGRCNTCLCNVIIVTDEEDKDGDLFLQFKIIPANQSKNSSDLKSDYLFAVQQEKFVWFLLMSIPLPCYVDS